LVEDFMESIDVAPKSFIKVRLSSTSVWLGIEMYV
jgi:hypothetical protein